MSNPYQSPGGFDVPPVKFTPYTISRAQVSYSEAINFAFSSPNWLVNCLLIGLVHFIPFVGSFIGPMLALGYLYGDYEGLIRDGRPVPSDFNLGKFMDYLQRGVMAFLAMLLAGIAAAVGMVICLAPVLLLGVLLAQKSEEAAALLMLLVYFLAFFLQFAFSIFIGPVVFRVGLSGKFEELFNYRWAMSFVKMMWPQMILGCIVAALVGALAGIVGLIACCVGLIPAVGYVNYLNFHLQRQWYEVFVTKGGEPIPLTYEPFGK